MASSKVVTTNTDLPRQSSICSLSTILADLQQQQQQQQSSSSSKSLITSMSMDDLLKNLYSSSEQTCQMPDGQFAEGNSSISRQGSFSLPKDLGEKTVDEVWKEIVSGTVENHNQRPATNNTSSDSHQQQLAEEMTLEDFLTKAGAVREEDVRAGAMVPVAAAAAGGLRWCERTVSDAGWSGGGIRWENGGWWRRRKCSTSISSGWWWERKEKSY
uniref:Uncharacterized protein n=1 Tax=Fagus sylvatica TaxID=28930 RepID=A0A2N9HDS5_FAGSY